MRRLGGAVSVALAQRLVGGPSVGGLQLVGPAGELMEGKPEGASDTVDDIPGGVRYSTLEATDGGGVEVCGVGEGLLG